MGWIDVRFTGYPYTGNNRRCGNANIQERLDRGFTNDKWKIRFQEVTTIHLQAIHSDHRPLLVYFDGAGMSGPKPFKYEAMWNNHLAIGFIVHDAWQRGRTLLSKLKVTKLALKKWN